MSKSLNWLVVGTGDIARKRVIPALEADPRCRLAAVCEPVAERAADIAGPRGICQNAGR